MKCEFKKGDKVNCYYDNSGNKFWAYLLEPYAEVKRVKYFRSAGIFQLLLILNNGQEEWFWENDFYKVEGG